MQTVSLSEALFTATQRRVLGLLYGKPDQRFYANEVVRSAQSGKGVVMRELERLLGAGVLTMTRHGNQTHYQANPDCPIYAELLGIVRKTFGIADHLYDALVPVAAQLTWVFVYGSIAKGMDNAGSDIDLMVIADGVHYAELMELLMPMEQALSRTINPTIYTVSDWQAKLAAENSFVLRVMQQEKLNVMGSESLVVMHDRA